MAGGGRGWRTVMREDAALGSCAAVYTKADELCDIRIDEPSGVFDR